MGVTGKVRKKLVTPLKEGFKKHVTTLILHDNEEEKYLTVIYQIGH